jgi:protein TonB
MLNQLIESKNHREENARKNGFLATTLGVFIAVLLSGWTYSLFAKNFGMGTGDFELSSLVAPVSAVEPAPPPKPEIQPERSQRPASSKIILKDLYEDLSRSTNPPKDLSGEKDVVNARQFDPNQVMRGDRNQIPVDTSGRSATSDTTDCGLCRSNEDRTSKDEEQPTPEVVVKPSPKPTEAKKPPLQSLGVINGKATHLEKPPYPATARAVRAEGAVNVQVLIDESGNVVSASAVSGHPMLRRVAEAAARQSKFSPTYLSNQAVKVTGVIVYQFKSN